MAESWWLGFPIKENIGFEKISRSKIFAFSAKKNSNR
jgi:hypothetical protein